MRVVTPAHRSLTALVVLAAVLSGCSTVGVGNTGADSASSGAPVVSPSTSLTSTAGPADGDFCSLTGLMLDAAAGWEAHTVAPDVYLAALDKANAGAPDVIRSEVSHFTSEGKKVVRGAQSAGVATPTDAARTRTSTLAWRGWTEAYCSADIAAKWASP